MSYKPILLEKLLERADRGTYRGHMPGHKGKPVLPQPIERIDFTELCDTGNLYDPDDNIIRRAEEEVAQALGARFVLSRSRFDCVYSAGGSTLLIQAALAAVTFTNPNPRILAARDAHRSFFSACALLGCSVDFLYPEYSPDGIAIGVPPDALRAALTAERPDAVYMTAPNYYGSYCRADELAAVCAEFDVPLIVDAAHAAHLVTRYGFGHPAPHASVVAVFSAHKTLEALGGAAFALTTGDFFTKDRLLRGMQLFGSSSPSYAILASLDLALSRALSDEGRAAVDRAVASAGALRRNLSTVSGVSIPTFTPNTSDPCRLTVRFDNIRGDTAAEWMERERGVVAEMADDRFVVFILTASDRQPDFDRLAQAIEGCAAHFCHGSAGRADAEITCPLTKSLPNERGSSSAIVASGVISAARLPHRFLTPPAPERVTDMRTALFSPTETVPLANAVGRIAAEIIAPYPPGVPVIAPGEKITQKALSFLQTKWYNMNRTVRVLRAGAQSKEDTR